MLCIKSQYTVEELIKKSRFIGVLAPCPNEWSVQEFLRGQRLSHPNASHIAYAFRIKAENGFICRFNDDGEPGGTAGKPIFQHVEGKQLTNIALTVIRYFGGVKLGAGGLMRAYGNTAKKVIEAAEMAPYIEWVERQIILDYKDMPAFEYLLKSLDGKIINQEFGGQIKVIVQLPANQLKTWTDTYAKLVNV